MKWNLCKPPDGAWENAPDSGFVSLLSGADLAQGVALSMAALCPVPAGLPGTKEVPSAGPPGPGFALSGSQPGGSEDVVPEGGDGLLALLPGLDRIQQQGPVLSLPPSPLQLWSQPPLSAQTSSVQLFSRGI